MSLMCDGVSLYKMVGTNLNYPIHWHEVRVDRNNLTICGET